MSENSKPAVRRTIRRIIAAGANRNQAKRLLENGADPADNLLCSLIDTICAGHGQQPFSLDGARSVFRSTEDDRNLEFTAICWSLDRPKLGVPVHLKLALRGAQLAYDLHVDSLKEFSSDDRLWMHFYPFAHGDTDNWDWRHHYTGNIPVPD